MDAFKAFFCTEAGTRRDSPPLSSVADRRCTPHPAAPTEPLSAAPQPPLSATPDMKHIRRKRARKVPAKSAPAACKNLFQSPGQRDTDNCETYDSSITTFDQPTAIMPPHSTPTTNDGSMEFHRANNFKLAAQVDGLYISFMGNHSFPRQVQTKLQIVVLPKFF